MENKEVNKGVMKRVSELRREIILQALKRVIFIYKNQD